jgi:hypothetical protein
VHRGVNVSNLALIAEPHVPQSLSRNVQNVGVVSGRLGALLLSRSTLGVEPQGTYWPVKGARNALEIVVSASKLGRLGDHAHLLFSNISSGIQSVNVNGLGGPHTGWSQTQGSRRNTLRGKETSMKKRLVGAVIVGVGAPLVALGLSVSQAAPATAKPAGTGPCSGATPCAVGGADTGNEFPGLPIGRGAISSDGQAQGGLFKGASPAFPGNNDLATGTDSSGHFVTTGTNAFQGTISGHNFSDGSFAGRRTGDVRLAPCTGRCG